MQKKTGHNFIGTILFEVIQFKTLFKSFHDNIFLSSYSLKHFKLRGVNISFCLVKLIRFNVFIRFIWPSSLLTV